MREGDGIGELVRSRGLGGVYKGQLQARAAGSSPAHRNSQQAKAGRDERKQACLCRVSHTHLTLPTMLRL